MCRQLKSHLVWLVAMTMLAPASSSAMLIELDLSVPGDGLLTLDDSTEILWLDLGLTTGFSHNDITGGIANTWYAEGWRHATQEEICGLFGNSFGLTDPCPHSDAISIDPIAIANFHEIMEPNITNGLSGSYGELVPELGAGVGQASVMAWEGGHYLRVEPDHIGVSADASSVGNWLVLRPVPEPSSALLVALGLASISYSRRPYRSLRVESTLIDRESDCGSVPKPRNTARVAVI